LPSSKPSPSSPGGTILAVAISNLGALLLSLESDLDMRFMRDEQGRQSGD
jgi:hypothetical protein